VARVLKESGLRLRRAITATTRVPRPGEVPEVDYHFLDVPAFEAMIAADQLLEYAAVFGNYYGTPRAEVDPHRATGLGVILVIDVQGAAQVRAKCPDHVSIFVRTSTPELLEQRLRGRGTDAEDVVQRRLATARAELARAGEYQHQVVNDDLDTAVRDVSRIVCDHFSEGEHA
jgi:guanylate kinase